MRCGKKQILARAIKKAVKSPCKFRIAAVGLDHRGQAIVSAVNTYRFGTRKGIHAEMAVMCNAPKSLRTIVIVRVNRKGELMPIDPCPTCASKAAELGIQIRTLR